MKKLFCCPALELFCCLPLWKTVLFVSSRAFSLSTPNFLLSTHVENSEATWKKATKCNKVSRKNVRPYYLFLHVFRSNFYIIEANLEKTAMHCGPLSYNSQTTDTPRLILCTPNSNSNPK